MAAAEGAKNLQKITVIVLYNYGGDAGNTLQYVLKSFTAAQQLRHHEQKRGQTEERWRNIAYKKTGPGTRKI